MTDHALVGPVVPHQAPFGVPGLIRERYSETRDRIVCADARRTLTGRQLELLSDTLADRIRAVAGPGAVMLRLPRGVDRAVAILGVLKAGCWYFPVDLAEPEARVETMAVQAEPVAVIGERRSGLPSLDLPLESDSDGDPVALDPVPADRPVYVMFTSGSTGRPKGVVLGSAALCNRLLWMRRAYPLTATDRVAQKTPYTFDPSGWELFLPLIAGARCEFAPEGAHRDPARLADFLIEREITVCHFVPSMLAEFLAQPAASAIRSLRQVFCSGEALPASLARNVLDRWPVRVHNLYGPTEAAIDVTYWDVPADLDPSADVLIGNPVDNTVLAVVDDEGQPTPVGDAGELWIGGDQLAIGYLGHPDITATAFPHRHGLRWYRSGDLVRQTPGGLAYLGRIDDQVKIGGVRVEPLEVEQVLGGLHDSVAVVAVPDPAGTVLVAVFAGEQCEVTDEDVRRYATARLPQALIPSAVVRLPRFPVAGTGKLDRTKLGELVRSWWYEHTGDDDDPLRAAWAKAIGIMGPVDETAGFLSLRGTSLAAIRLTGAIRETTRVDVPLAEFLEANISLTDLRALVGVASVQTAPELPGGSQRDRSPLAPEQYRLWLLSQLYPDSPAYNVAALVRFAGRLDVAALGTALHATARRHDILRARVDEDSAGRPCLCYETDVRADLAVTDAPGPLDDADVDEFARRVTATVIGLQVAPLFRAHLLRSADQACLVLVFHHLVADQRTVEIVLEDLAASYAASPPVPAPSYADYAVAAAAKVGDERWTADLEYWRDLLAGAPPELALPFRLPGTAQPERQTLAGTVETVRLDAEFGRRLDTYLRDRATTSAGFFLAVFGAVLSAWSAQPTVVIGVPSSRRRSTVEHDVAGFLVDTLPIRLDLEGLRTFDDLLGHARNRYVAAMDHARPTFDAVVAALHRPHSGARNPVYQVWLNDLTDAAPLPSFDGVTVTPVLPPVHSALFELGLYLHRDGDDLLIRLVRAVDVVAAGVSAELLAQCVAVATQVLADPDIAIDAIDLVTERARALLPRPDLVLPPAGERTTIVEAVAAVVARSPDSLAVVSPEGELTYRELWASVEATATTTTGEFAVIPAARAAALPVTVLAHWRSGAGVALVDAALPAPYRAACAAAARDAPRGLSHVLYTSGTTGTPVPVAVPHGPLREFLRWYTDMFHIGPNDRFALLAGPGHDPVLREMFAALTTGAQLHVPPPDVVTDPGRVMAWLAESRITVLHATPALLELMLGSQQPMADSARLIVVGGDRLTWGLVRRLRSASDAPIVNAYGTTETPQIASLHQVQDDLSEPDDAVVPVGQGVGGQQLLVLTPSGRSAGVGQQGEVVVRGRNLAEGYLTGGRTDRFDIDPVPGVRIFRTGDHGRYDVDGLVRIAGRADWQVSIGGHRLEPGEVEAVALRHPLVKQAVATLARTEAGPALVLQVTASGPLDGAELRAHLRALLPAHAVPVTVRVVGRFALGPTGKVSQANGRKESAVDASAVAELSEPGRSVLATFERTARRVIGRSIGQDENFFEAGLTSLMLVELHKISTASLVEPFPLTTLFAYPNLRTLRRFLAGESTAPGDRPRSTDGDRVRRRGGARSELRKQLRRNQTWPAHDEA